MTRKRGATLLAWGAGLALLAWALGRASWSDMAALLRGFPSAGLVLLILLNLIILLALTARWRVFVRTLPQVIPFPALVQARLASFAVSYFTPGPQFGGEPLQVIALHQRGAPASAATATVALDKLVELLANFTVLALGVIALWVVGMGDAGPRAGASLLALGLLALPLTYLILLWRGWLPLAAAFRWLAARAWAARLRRGLGMLAESEALAGELARTRPGVILRALVWAAAAWALMILEFGLSARFLGADMPLAAILAALAGARFAFLTPIPGGLGALASSQVFLFSTLGYDPNIALALTLYIRARDLIIGLMGAALAGRLLRE